MVKGSEQLLHKDIETGDRPALDQNRASMVERAKAKILANLEVLKEDFKEGLKDSAVGQVVLWYADLTDSEARKKADRS